ncbi:eukaryotic peptide chain release factor GTP-binding subunit ERF3A-like [Spodoptera litura]|uniref:Eukaryotic peptide chain release factor GTP-binding subunit ERF3A-like n=1 Tax=Spodoptera litura TaxID=69820 RepID=A0A9J7EQN8_SPOLT|nr:eukaryotic peptide chain release factor GTP-binding subunit ERF3A-like [Spodoptera litura]
MHSSKQQENSQTNDQPPKMVDMCIQTSESYFKTANMDYSYQSETPTDYKEHTPEDALRSAQLFLNTPVTSAGIEVHDDCCMDTSSPSTSESSDSYYTSLSKQMATNSRLIEEVFRMAKHTSPKPMEVENESPLSMHKEDDFLANIPLPEEPTCTNHILSEEASAESTCIFYKDANNISTSSIIPEEECPKPVLRLSENSAVSKTKNKKNKKSKKQLTHDDHHIKKDHVNLVLVGHVDAGKSTIGGQIMSLMGIVDQRTLKKYEKEAREKSRESWYLSWALDTNQEERDKGKTVEVGRAYFTTKTKHFTILDAPGHKSFVPNMIGGAAQADLAVLVISARKGEFETGFDRGGQTREHAMLVKTAGVKYMVTVINKMDDPTVNWSQNRYNECKEKLKPFLKKLGFTESNDLAFMPISGQTGHGILHQVPEDICPWYRGPSFIQLVDELPSFNRNDDGYFVMPIADKFKEMGTVLMGKVESGRTRKGETLLLMPNRLHVTVDQLWSDDIEVTVISCGENVKIKIKSIEEDDVSTGFVLCDVVQPITIGKVFDAQLHILQHKSIICAGYSAVMHIHCAVEEVVPLALLCLVNTKTGEKSKTRPRYIKEGQAAIVRIACSGIICLEPFKKFNQLGRLTLRDENKTVAIGKVLKVIE